MDHPEANGGSHEQVGKLRGTRVVRRDVEYGTTRLRENMRCVDQVGRPACEHQIRNVILAIALTGVATGIVVPHAAAVSGSRRGTVRQ